MDEEISEAFQKSYQRTRNHPDFLGRFYEILLEASDEVREKFAHTDFPKQIRMLKASLLMMMQASFSSIEGQEHMETLAERHSRRDLDIRPELYELWLDCLVEAVKEADPLFDSRVENAWRTVMKPGIEFMKARY